MSQLSTRRSLGWSGFLALGVMAVLLSLALTPGVASAHAKLAGSDPADGATVATGVTRITLTFNEEISVDQSTAQLIDNSGTAVSGASSAVDKADRTREYITTSALQPGKYQVKWHSVTEDDNGISDGSFSFSVTGAQDSTSGNMSTTGTGTSLPTTGGGQGLLVVAAFGLGAIVLVGAGAVLRRRNRI